MLSRILLSGSLLPLFFFFNFWLFLPSVLKNKENTEVNKIRFHLSTGRPCSMIHTGRYQTQPVVPNIASSSVIGSHESIEICELQTLFGHRPALEIKDNSQGQVNEETGEALV